MDADSSDCPPERKQIVGRDGTMVLWRVLTVNQAISSCEDLSEQPIPGITMLGFNIVPSIKRF